MERVYVPVRTSKSARPVEARLVGLKSGEVWVCLLTNRTMEVWWGNGGNTNHNDESLSMHSVVTQRYKMEMSRQRRALTSYSKVCAMHRIANSWEYSKVGQRTGLVQGVRKR